MFHSDETFMCMHAQEVFFQIKSIRKSVTFLKMVIKKLFSLQNIMKKLFEMHYSFEKKLSASPKNGNPPDKK